MGASMARTRFIHEEYAQRVLECAFPEEFESHQRRQRTTRVAGRPGPWLDGVIHHGGRTIAVQVEAKNYAQVPQSAAQFSASDGDFDAKLFIVMKPNLNNSLNSATRMTDKCGQILAANNARADFRCISWAGDGYDGCAHFDADVVATRTAVRELTTTKSLSRVQDPNPSG